MPVSKPLVAVAPSTSGTHQATVIGIDRRRASAGDAIARIYGSQIPDQ